MTLALIFDSAGFGEWFVLLVVVLIVVGPRKLPSAARTLGNYYAKFRRAAESFKRQLLDMETEFSRHMDEAENSVSEAFKVEGDEATAEPAVVADEVSGETRPMETDEAQTPVAQAPETQSSESVKES